MIQHNFTTIQNRVKRLYSVEGMKVSSSGIQTSFLKTAGICVGFATVIGAIINIAAGQFLYNPLRGGINNIDPSFLIIFVGGPIGIAFWLEYGKIAKVQVKTAIIKILQTIINPRIDSDGKRFSPRSISNNQEVL